LKGRAIFLLFGAQMLLLNACVIALVDKSSEGQSWPYQSEYHKSLDLDAGGKIVLENTDGGIEISGWDEERVDITASRSRALPSSAGVYFIGERFSPADIQAQSTGKDVRIRTEEKKNRDDETIVHYNLKVPRSVCLDSVSSGRGDIFVSDVYGRAVLAAREGRIGVQNYSGSLNVRLGSGSVEAELLDLRPGDSISIRVEQGDIVIYLEAGIAARFSLEAPAGNISSELEINQPLPAQKVSSTTGEGGISIELIALQGDITIRKAEGSS
jgi:hypothetical protein